MGSEMCIRDRLGEDSWSVVCAACCHMTLVFAVMHLYNILDFFLLLLSIPFFKYFFSNVVLINRRNGPRYQRVLALCAFLRQVMPKELILQGFCVQRLCMFCFTKICVGTDFVVYDLWFDDLHAE